MTFTGYGGETQERPQPPSSLWVTLARAEEWEENSTGWREKVVVGGHNHKLAWRQLITSMAFADAKTSHLTEKLKCKIKRMCVKNKKQQKKKQSGPQPIRVKSQVQSDRLPPKGMRYVSYCLTEVAQTAAKAQSHLHTH